MGFVITTLCPEPYALRLIHAIRVLFALAGLVIIIFVTLAPVTFVTVLGTFFLLIFGAVTARALRGVLLDAKVHTLSWLALVVVHPTRIVWFTVSSRVVAAPVAAVISLACTLVPTTVRLLLTTPSSFIAGAGRFW